MNRQTNYPGRQSSGAKRDYLEELTYRKLKSITLPLEYYSNKELEAHRAIVKGLLVRDAWISDLQGPDGDNGIDLFGSCMGYSFPVQCKNLLSNATADHIRAFLGAMLCHPLMPFGVFVVSKPEGYTEEAKNVARCSSIKIILSDIDHVVNDINNYCLELQQLESTEGIFLREFHKLRTSNIKLSRKLDKHEKEVKDIANNLEKL
ncbi:13045_t:CDS:2, partial [Dentiscutata heterogama]